MFNRTNHRYLDALEKFIAHANGLGYPIDEYDVLAELVNDCEIDRIKIRLSYRVNGRVLLRRTYEYDLTDRMPMFTSKLK